MNTLIQAAKRYHQELTASCLTFLGTFFEFWTGILKVYESNGMFAKLFDASISLLVFVGGGILLHIFKSYWDRRKVK